MEESENQVKKGNNSMIVVGAIIIVVIIAGYILMKQSGNEAPAVESEAPEENVLDEAKTVETAQPDTTNSENMMGDEVQIVNIEAGSFYYKPNEIRVKKGQKVKIVMNSVSMMHNVNIDELGVTMPIVKNGDTGTVEFTADTAGSFEYYCSVANHRAQGQVGTLIVE